MLQRIRPSGSSVDRNTPKMRDFNDQRVSDDLKGFSRWEGLGRKRDQLGCETISTSGPHENLAAYGWRTDRSSSLQTCRGFDFSFFSFLLPAIMSDQGVSIFSAVVHSSKTHTHKNNTQPQIKTKCWIIFHSPRMTCWYGGTQTNTTPRLHKGWWRWMKQDKFHQSRTPFMMWSSAEINQQSVYRNQSKQSQPFQMLTHQKRGW